MTHIFIKKNIFNLAILVGFVFIAPGFVNAQYYYDTGYADYTYDTGYADYSYDTGYADYTYDTGNYDYTYDTGNYDYTYDTGNYDYTYDTGNYDYTYDTGNYDYTYDTGNYDYTYDTGNYDYTYDTGNYDYTYDTGNYDYTYDTGYYDDFSYPDYTDYIDYSEEPYYSYPEDDYYYPEVDYYQDYSYPTYSYNYSSNSSCYGSGCSSNSTSHTTTKKLSVQCVVSDTSIKEGESVTYTANVSGGNSPYTYDWSGSVNSSSRSTTIKYSNDGTYRAYITVTDDDGRTASDECATVHVSNTTNNPTSFGVQCVVSDTSVEEGDYVTFTAEVSGNTSPYTYDWNGDVNSSSKSVRARFNDGSYDVSVTVKDKNGKSITDDCATVRVTSDDEDDDDDDNDDEDDLEVQCVVSDSSLEDGDSVTVSVDIDGGNSPFDIQWDGDTDEFEDFDDEDNSQRVRIDSNQSRIELEVTVEDDDGNEDSDTCIIRLDDDDSGSNYRSTNDGELSGLSSVFLSQVPYTGSEDVLKVIGFIVGLLIWSAIVATVLLRNKNRKEISSKAQAFKEANKLKKFSN